MKGSLQPFDANEHMDLLSAQLRFELLSLIYGGSEKL
jgi:hypothetical protein